MLVLEDTERKMSWGFFSEEEEADLEQPYGDVSDHRPSQQQQGSRRNSSDRGCHATVQLLYVDKEEASGIAACAAGVASAVSLAAGRSSQIVRRGRGIPEQKGASKLRVVGSLGTEENSAEV
jgi:hypothetical protein